MTGRSWLVGVAVLTACDPVVGLDPTDDASTSGFADSSVGDVTSGPGTSTTAGPTGDGGVPMTTSAASEATSGEGPMDTSSSEGGTDSSDGTGSSGDSSSSSGGPTLPDGVPPDWTLSFPGFDGYALQALADGRIVVGGREDGTGRLYVVDADGGVLSSVAIDPALWGGLPPATETVTSVGVLDGGRLAVLVARGDPDDPYTLDGVLALDVESLEVVWSAVLHSDVLYDEPQFFEERFPGRTEQLITTQEGALYVAGKDRIDDTSTEFPENDTVEFWVQRLDPNSGERVWWNSQLLWDSFGNVDVEYRLFLNDVAGRVLLQANDRNKSSGRCFWVELDPDSGVSVATDFSIGTGYEYCWPAAVFSDGSVGAPAGYLIAGATDIHVAGPDDVVEYPLATTAFQDATRLYLDGSDAAYVEGALADSSADGLGTFDLTATPSSTLLLAWPSTGWLEPSPIRGVDFGLDDEVLVLRDIAGETWLEQRTVD